MKLIYGLLICSFIGLQSCGQGGGLEHSCTETCTKGTHNCGEHCKCGDDCTCTKEKSCSKKCDMDEDLDK